MAVDVNLPFLAKFGRLLLLGNLIIFTLLFSQQLSSVF